MPISVTPAIPASRIVNVVPSVLAAGGDNLQLNGLILTTSKRPPIGSIVSFGTQTDVANYFGATAPEAGLATIYFNGPDTATVLPAELLIAQYPLAAVSAYLRGASMAGVALSTLQALSGTLSIAIDGVTHSATVNLGAATSFSNAAEIMQTDLGLSGRANASITGSIGGTFTGSTLGTILTITAVTSGTLQPGDVVSGSVGGNSLPAGCTVLSQLTGVIGGIGTYRITAGATPTDMGSTTITSSSKTLVVSAVASGTVNVGDLVAGSGVAASTYVASQLTGTPGGVGNYGIGVANTVPSEAMTTTTPAVQYDSVSGGFIFNSGTTGVGSTMAFATGALATPLMLTSATGAVLSQGSNATDPVAFMDSVKATTQNWASFMTTWEPTDADKENFAKWTNAQKSRYVYELWDTSVLNKQVTGPSAAIKAIQAANYAGICISYEDPTIDTELLGQFAAFGMGWTASLDFTRRNGRQNASFKGQTGLKPQVSDDTSAGYLASYGINYYGDFTTANEAFLWYYPGVISGPFLWKDSYVNQIWLTNGLQVAGMTGLGNTPSIPYNAAGYALIESFFRDPIDAAVNFGAIRKGVALSQAQIAEVNAAAGLAIDTTLVSTGWYLQVLPATAVVRRARTSPPCTLWYTDGGSVNQITLASIEIQ